MSLPVPAQPNQDSRELDPAMQPNTHPINNYSIFRPLEECEDLDAPVFRLLTSALSVELGFDLFGFDALVESRTKKVFVVDINFLPGFKGMILM